MAITKTTSVQRVEVYPSIDSEAEATTNAGNVTVMCVYEDAMDDPNDTDLPVTATRVKHILRYSDEENATATDVSGEDQLVQDICGAVWG
jgi:hypothetical protein